MTRTVSSPAGESAIVDSQHLLCPQPVHFFETFGFLKIPRLFSSDIDEVIGGFEDLFGDQNQPVRETHEANHGDARRVIIPDFIEQSQRLDPLQHDPRILGIAQVIIGPEYTWASNGGNLF